MSDKQAQGGGSAAPESAKQPWALILDLDTAAVDGVEALYAAYAEALSAQGIALDPVLFARFLLGEPTAGGLNALLALLKQPRDKAAKVIEALQPALEQALLKAPVRPVSKALAELVVQRGGRVLALTSLAPEVAARLLAQVGLAADTPVVQVHPEGCGVLGSDAWFRTVHTAQIPEHRCFALTATADSSRAAVCSHLTTAACLGPLTEHQDFGGVDWLGKGASAKDAAAIFEIFETRIAPYA